MLTHQTLPAARDWVSLSRHQALFETLTGASRLLINAAAGTGKTSLCAAWLQQNPAEVIYQRCTEDLANGRLLADQLQARRPEAKTDLLQASLEELHAWFAAWDSPDSPNSPGRVILLDQVHLLRDAEGIELVNRLLQLELPGLRLILLTRCYPEALMLAPLISARQLTLISQAELLWQEEDLERLAAGLTLSAEQSQLILTRSAGVIGVMTAWLDCLARGPEQPLLQPQYRQNLDQAFSELPSLLQQQLPALASLRELSAQELELLIEPARIPMLRALLHDWHLLEPSEQVLPPYWQDYLRWRGQLQGDSASSQADLASSCLARGRPAAALAYAVLADDESLIQTVLAGWQPDQLDPASADALLAWVRTRSEAMLLQSPRLYVFYLWALILTHHASNYQAFEALLQRHAEVREQPRDSREGIRLAHWLSYFHAHLAGMSEDAERSLAAFEQALAFSQDKHSSLHANVLVGLGGEYFYQSRWQECLDCLESAQTLFRELGQSEDLINAEIRIARTKLMMGRIDQAVDAYHQTLRTCSSEKGPAFAQVFSLTDLAWIALIRREPDNMRTLLARSEALADSKTPHIHWLYLVRALDLMLLCRDHTAAGHILATLKGIIANFPAKYSRDYQTRLLWHRVETDALGPAASLLKDLGDLDKGVEELTAHHQNLAWYSILVRFLLRQKRQSEAYALNQSLLEVATERGTGLYRQIFELVQAVLLYRGGHQKEQALNRFILLLEALLSQNRAGLILYAGPEALPMLHELRPVFQQNRREHQIDELKALFPEVTRLSGSEPDLSHREQSLLPLLEQDLSYTEIANRQGVSVNTVKTHLKSLYRKLNAGTRRDALLTARSRWLL